MNVTLVIHQSAGWETSLWDHVNAVVGTLVIFTPIPLLSLTSLLIQSASNRRLSLEEIKAIQSNLHLIPDSNARKKLGYLDENSSTLFDVLRTGYVTL